MMDTTLLFALGVLTVGIIVAVYGYRIIFSPEYLERLRKEGWRDEKRKVSNEFQNAVDKYRGWTTLGMGILAILFSLWLLFF